MTPSNILSITIPGEPFAQPRARSFALMKGSKGARTPVLNERGIPIVRHYDDREAVSWKTSAQDRMLAALREAGAAAPFITKGPVRVEIDALFSCLKGDRKTRNPRPLRRKSTGKDLDNIEKAVLDAAKGVLWLDDAQVSEMSSRKLYAPQDAPPRVEIRVWALTEEIEEENTCEVCGGSPRDRPEPHVPSLFD